MPHVCFHVKVAQIYQSIEFSRLATLVPFVDAFQLERSIVDAARHCDLQVSAVKKHCEMMYESVGITLDEEELVGIEHKEGGWFCEMEVNWNENGSGDMKNWQFLLKIALLVRLSVLNE